MTAEQTAGRLSLMECRVAPGFGNLPHAHGGEDEAFYIASGTFRFVNGSSKIDASAGDFIYVPRGTRHAFKNLGEEHAKLLVFFSPAGAERFFLDHGRQSRPVGQPAQALGRGEARHAGRRSRRPPHDPAPR